MREHEFRRTYSTYMCVDGKRVRMLVSLCSTCPGTAFWASLETRNGINGARLQLRSWEKRHRGLRVR